MPDLTPGTVVAGYRIEALVGRGGMGVVYRALQRGLERPVALKVIAPELVDDPAVRGRFLAEAQAAASVDHPNVIPVHDAGEADGVAYLAMRYVDGSDLRSLVKLAGPLSPVAAAEIVAQAAGALDALHRAGLVHRDVKPANLLVDVDRHVYLTDFGLAKAVLTRSGPTRTGHWVGTLDYVAPEQIRGGRVDARADVYALGGVLHYALTGHVPFEREGDEAKLWAQLSAPPPRPSDHGPDLPAELDAAVARAMAKAPEDRYPSAGDLGRAASAAAHGRTPTEPERRVARGAAAPDAAPSEPGLAGDAATRTAPDPELPTRTAETPPRGPRDDGEVVAGPHARRVRLAAAAAAVVAVVAVLVIVLADFGEDPSGRAARPTATAVVAETATPWVARAAQTVEDVGDRPTGIAYAAGDLWVASPESAYLTRVEAETGTERADHPKVGRDAQSIVGDGDDVWVAIGRDHVVVRLDARTGEERDRLAVPGAPRRIEVQGGDVWVATASEPGEPGLLLRYDRAAGRLEQTIPVPEGVGALAASPDTLWIVKRDTNRLARVVGTALEDTVDAPGPVRSMRYGEGAMWLVLAQEDTIGRYAMDWRGPVTAAAGHAPTTALVAGGHLFVASRNDQSVLVLDPETLKPQTDPIPVPLNPIALAGADGDVWVTSLTNAITRIEYR